MNRSRLSVNKETFDPLTAQNTLSCWKTPTRRKTKAKKKAVGLVSDEINDYITWRIIWCHTQSALVFLPIRRRRRFIINNSVMTLAWRTRKIRSLGAKKAAASQLIEGLPGGDSGGAIDTKDEYDDCDGHYGDGESRGNRLDPCLDAHCTRGQPPPRYCNARSSEFSGKK